MKSWHYEKLASGGHSIRLNDQFRLVVEITDDGPGKTVVVRGIRDYH